MTPLPNSPSNNRKTRKRERSVESKTSSISPLKTRKHNSPEKGLPTLNPKEELMKACPRTDECLALSAEYMPQINAVFDYFSNFKMLSKQIGTQFLNISSGSNGFVNILHFSDNENSYHSTAIMKSAMNLSNNKLPDNLVYEGLVGLYYINQKCYQFPCFVETYGIYRYKSHPTHPIPPLKNYLMNNERGKYMKIPNADFEDGLVHLFTNRNSKETPPASKKTIYNSKAMKQAFEKPSDLCILIQSITFSKDISTYLTELLFTMQSLEKREVKFLFNTGLLTMFFQVYSVLSYISDEYTHNDLHPGNILVYPLGQKYIKMVYHLKNEAGNMEEVVFYTNNIIKIIDYGRSYVNGKHFNSVCFYQSVCQHEKSVNPANEDIEYDCDEDNVKKYQDGEAICGRNIGFTSIWKQPADPKTICYISSVQRNKTADLLLLQKLAILFTRYVYKYELGISYGGTNDAPAPITETKYLLDYLENPVFYLIMNAFSLYRNILTENDKTEFILLLKNVREFLKTTNHPMSKHLTGYDKLDFKLIFDSVSYSFIVADIQKKDPALFKQIDNFEKTLKFSLFDSKSAFDTYRSLVVEKGKATDLAKKEEFEKKIKMQTIMMNRYHMERPMYAINEIMEDSIILSNVDKVFYGLTKNLQNSESITKDFFDTPHSLYKVPYTYFGELHVYLDGTNRDSQFIPATRS